VTVVDEDGLAFLETGPLEPTVKWMLNGALLPLGSCSWPVST
jgi:hypothetical protein